MRCHAIRITRGREDDVIAANAGPSGRFVLRRPQPRGQDG
jgi:hypothetical protein